MYGCTGDGRAGDGRSGGQAVGRSDETEPLASDPLTARPPDRLTARPPDQVNILLVDDQPANLVALEAMLQGLGQNLITAGSGREALKWLLTHEFAVILLDVKMPEMDGFETATLIRQRDKSRHTPIIFLTAADKTQEQAVRGYAVGAADYLVKPVVPEFVALQGGGLRGARQEVRAAPPSGGAAPGERARGARARRDARRAGARPRA